MNYRTASVLVRSITVLPPLLTVAHHDSPGLDPGDKESTITYGSPRMPTDILTVLLRISTVASRLQYGLNHAHINRSGATEVLNSLKLPWSFPDQHGSSRTTTNHDGLVDGATTVLSRITTVHHDSLNRSEPWSEP